MSKLKVISKMETDLTVVEELDCGQVFFDPDSGDYFLALEINCLNLQTFTIIDDEKFKLVKPVEAELIIK